MRRLTLCLVLASAVMASEATTSSSGKDAGDAWILHITDPHLFVDGLSDKDRQDAQKESDKKEKETKTKKIDRIERQRTLNADALKDVLTRANAFVHAEGEPRFVLLTGDFDVDPCWTANLPEKDAEDSAAVAKKCLIDYDKAQRDNQIKLLTELLATSTIPDIYLMPGNNDIARELADESVLRYFGNLIDEVRQGLANKKSGVRVHDLVGCYLGAADSDATWTLRAHRIASSRCRPTPSRTARSRFSTPTQSSKSGRWRSFRRSWNRLGSLRRAS